MGPGGRGGVKEDKMRESLESDGILEQIMVVMPTKTRGRREPRMGESCGHTNATAEYMNLELI